MWQIVHIITKLELGGAQLATLDEVQNSAYATAGRALIMGPGGLLDAHAQSMAGVAVLPTPAMRRAVHPVRDLTAFFQILAHLTALRARTPEARLLVHTHSSKAGILGRWAAVLAGADLIVHSVHGFGHSHHGSRWARLAYRTAERWTGRVTDGYTADSAANIHQGRSEGLFGTTPARVVRCGVDLKPYQPRPTPTSDLRASLGISPSQRVVLSLSCLKPQKDPLTLVRVASRVVETFPDVVFLVAGDGQLRPRVQALASELGLGDHLRLLGWRQDVPALLQTCDLLLMTSRWEGLPQAFVQAMAACRPIVATSVDGAAEAIDHGDNGFLCMPGDVEGLAGYVLRILQEPGMARTMGDAGQRRAQPFSREKMLDDLQQFYEVLATTSRTWRRLRGCIRRASSLVYRVAHRGSGRPTHIR